MIEPAGAPWFTRAFRRCYLDVYSHRDDASAAREARIVASLLGVERGARLLDAGCGAGRHSRAFAALGADVVGVDLSMELLAERGSVDGVRLVRADFRRQPFHSGTFAHVVSLFTSFGYFDAAGDRAQLSEVRRVLCTGGTYVLDFLNRTNVEATLVRSSERRIGAEVVRERRRIVGGRVEKDVEFGGGERWTESVRLYGRDELMSLLGDQGLTVVSVHGDLAGGAWSEISPRLVLTAVAQ